MKRRGQRGEAESNLRKKAREKDEKGERTAEAIEAEGELRDRKRQRQEMVTQQLLHEALRDPQAWECQTCQDDKGFDVLNSYGRSKCWKCSRPRQPFYPREFGETVEKILSSYRRASQTRGNLIESMGKMAWQEAYVEHGNLYKYERWFCNQCGSLRKSVSGWYRRCPECNEHRTAEHNKTLLKFLDDQELCKDGVLLSLIHI